MSPRKFILLCLAAFLQRSAGHEDMQAGTAAINDQNVAPPSYFRHPYATGWIYAHITLMIIAWAFVLPLAVVLSIARARLQSTVGIAFHALNASGLALGVLYNGMTPDLYAHSVHGRFSWIVTGLSIAWSLARCSTLISQRLLKPSRTATASHNRMQRIAEDSENSDEYAESDDTLPGMDDVLPSAAGKRSETSRIRRWVSQSIRLTRLVLDRLLLLLGFAACVSGFVVFSGNFRNLEVYGGLSHWIKGGVFFWCGLLAHGRWIGAFADFGWAWNIKPKGKATSMPSLEFFESFFIWLYGASNVFLEHLSNWGGEWSATDFEHISITLLFFGGGLLGMLVESDGVRRMLDVGSSQNKSSDDWNALRSPRRKVSLNPIPPLTIMLLGLMMSSHHQQTELGTKLHSQWGLLFCGAAIFRLITLISLHHKPPSHRPPRPMTELVTSFCLTTGGILFMMSGRDSIAGLASSKIMAMTAFTATAGLSAVILSWEVVVFAIKGRAQKCEPQWIGPDKPFSA